MKMKQGDIVQYSSKFLRNICDYSKRSADAYGTIDRIEGDDNFKIVYIKDSKGLPEAVNINNLILKGKFDEP